MIFILSFSLISYFSVIFSVSNLLIFWILSLIVFNWELQFFSFVSYILFIDFILFSHSFNLSSIYVLIQGYQNYMKIKKSIWTWNKWSWSWCNGFKTHDLIKGKDTYLDFYDIGSFEGNEKDKNWFVERVNLFFIVFDSTSENIVNDIQIYINKIKYRENKEPITKSLWANKIDLINENNKSILENIEKNFNEYKIYKETQSI